MFTIQDLRAELRNITTQCLFLMLYAWIALNWAGTCLLSTYTYYIYLLVFEWLYFESIALDIKPTVCLLIPLQDRNLSDSWANVGRFVYLSKYPYLLAVGCWQNAIKLILLARHIFTIIRIYYIYFFLIATFLNFLHVHSIESQPVDVKLMWTLLSKNDLLLYTLPQFTVAFVFIILFFKYLNKQKTTLVALLLLSKSQNIGKTYLLLFLIIACS